MIENKKEAIQEVIDKWEGDELNMCQSNFFPEQSYEEEMMEKDEMK
jgi:hypothetical protein